MKKGKLPSECMKHHLDELPEECRSLRLAAFECKRGMVNFFSQILYNRPSHASLSLICGNASAEIVQVLLPRRLSKRARLHRPQSYPRLRRARFGALVGLFIVDQIVILPARDC